MMLLNFMIMKKYNKPDSLNLSTDIKVVDEI